MRVASGVYSLILLGAASIAAAQTQAPEPGSGAASWRKVEDMKAGETRPEGLVVTAGTRVPLSLINSVSTKHSVEGDRIYLQTSFPILVQNRIVIPPGSYVEGTVTEVKRPGHLQNRRGEMYLRFDSLTLPNGVTREFRARIGGIDGDLDTSVDRTEGKVKSASSKGHDAGMIAQTAGAGAAVGAIAGAVSGRLGTGIATGAAAGGAIGVMSVLLSRGPDAVLPRGTMVEMVLDRPLTFEERELDFSHAAPPVPVMPATPAQTPTPRGRWPL